MCASGGISLMVLMRFNEISVKAYIFIIIIIITFDVTKIYLYKELHLNRWILNMQESLIMK